MKDSSINDIIELYAMLCVGLYVWITFLYPASLTHRPVDQSVAFERSIVRPFLFKLNSQSLFINELYSQYVFQRCHLDNQALLQ